MAEETVDPAKAQKAYEKKLKDRLGAAAFDSPSIKHWNSTGSPILDRQLREWKAVGGWPGGKIIDLYGPAGAGKTNLCLRACQPCQDLGGKVYFINPPEQGLSTDLLEKNHVRWTEEPSDHWCTLNPFSMESCCGALEEIVLEHFEGNRPVIVIVDPLSSLGLSAYSMDSTVVGATKPAAENAKFLHEWFRRGVGYYLAGSKITILVTRHQTATPRVEFGSVDHTTHGSAPDFYAWMRIKMLNMVMEDPSDTNKKGNGQFLRATITKNKSGRPGGQVSMPWYYDTGWSPGMEVIAHLLSTGMLTKGSTGLIEYDGVNYYHKALRELYHSSEVCRDNLLAMLDLAGGVVSTKAVVEKKAKARKPGSRS